MLLFNKFLHVGIILLQLLLELLLEGPDLVDLHLVGSDTLLDRVDGGSHLMRNCGIEHRGEVLLTDHVIVLLSLCNVNELDHFALLLIPNDGGDLHAKEDMLTAF